MSRGPTDFQTPSTQVKWQLAVDTYGLNHVSIHDGNHKLSSSKMGHEQFLLLRVIYSERKPEPAHVLTSRDYRTYVSPGAFNEAKRLLLLESVYFQAYLSSFDKTRQQLRAPPFPDLGTFSLPRLYQIDVLDTSTHHSSTPMPKITYSPPQTRSKTKASSHPMTPSKRYTTPPPIDRATIFDSSPTGSDQETTDTYSNPSSRGAAEDDILTGMTREMLVIASPTSPGSSAFQVTPEAARDEQLVNVALIAFLGALTLHTPVKGYWSMHRRSFWLCSQANGTSQQKEGSRIYRADVDGFLKFEDSNVAKAIVEVKPFCRNDTSRTAIRIQESAQMAAWVNESPPEGLRKDESAV